MPTRLLVFFLIATALVAVMHFVLYRRLVRPSGLSERGAKAARAALWFGSFSIVLAFVVGRWLPEGPWTRPLNWLGFGAMGVYAVLLPLTLARDVVLLVGAGWRRVTRGRTAPPVEAEAPNAEAASLTRREFFGRASAALVLAAGLVVSIAGFFRAIARPEVVRQRIDIDGLPPALDGFTIAQISDVHIGPTLRRPWLEDIVARTNALGADVIAVTGDLIDGRVADLQDQVAPLAELKAPRGVYFVTGNHEYYWDAEAWIDEVRRLGLDALVNDHRLLDVDGGRLLLAGVTDLRADDILESHVSDPAAARAGAPEADASVLLAHQPGSLHAAKEAGYDLQLSGHTHGGQFFPYNFIIHLVHPAVAGHYRFGNLQVYVNRGTGYWGPPLRSTPKAEITLIELRRPAEAAS